ncbi:MoxR-like ATPase [Parafrankia irregularis]|uniref:MoxR-like ATPase n=1 Tax=Parafrankia irregularis TaxID=795642 RepID=A0A0S4QHL0_9ACTN|nr:MULTISPECIES: MoxR family ATPase [Parafrankia]MBE3204114.1 MoxR family ATPase [Parafrankia sp. CH37]CUU55009.1 MoxR-like ATPase [Parafrankia irregularis]
MTYLPRSEDARQPFGSHGGPDRHGDPSYSGDLGYSGDPNYSDDGTAFRQVHDAVVANVERVVHGKTDVVRLAVACLFAGGHLLVEDVPGVGKTSLAKALATSVGGTWQRLQFTPDLLPSDITGISMWRAETGRFEFRRGAVFANVVVGDEINRASPKTQSALLEVMEEQQVTVDGETHPVPRPFMVLATQNPIDLEGTYRLPEAQLDRFLMRISVGYPDLDTEMAILSGGPAAEAPHLGAVTSPGVVNQMIGMVRAAHTAPSIVRYVASLAARTRTRPELRLGLSPRGSLGWLRAAQALAYGQGRPYVVPDDVKAVARPVLTHRLVLTTDADVRGTRVADVVDDVLASVPVPTTTDAV